MENAASTETGSAGFGPHFFSLSRTNAGIVVASHAVPAIGVLFFGWDAFVVVFVFWMENAVIGLFAIVKILFANSSTMTWGDLERQISVKWLRPSTRFGIRPSRLEGKKFVITGSTNIKFVLVPFFCAHYGLFMVVHGAMVIGVMGAAGPSVSTGFFGEFTDAWDSWMWFALAGLFAGHCWDFCTDYLPLTIRGKTSSIFFFVAPYGRVIVMHVVILAGGFFLLLLGLPRMTAILLILIKAVMELFARKQMSRARTAGDPS